MRVDVHYRLAFGADAPALAAMSRDLVEIGLDWSWVPARILHHVRAPESVVLVAEQGALAVGFAIMRFAVDDGHLDLLAVRPAHRRAGIGRGLVAWLERSALVAGLSVVYLEVRAGNAPALAFYEALGYRRIQRLRGYYQGRETAIRMARDLWCPAATGATGKSGGAR